MSFKTAELGRGTTLTDLLAASIQNELLAERASELGRTGERVAKAMSALSALEPGSTTSAPGPS